MAYVQIKLEVCDIGGQAEQGRAVQKYRIAEPGGRIRGYVLCDEHAEPLRALLAEMTRGTVRPRGAARAAASMDEVKAARKKAAPRRRASAAK